MSSNACYLKNGMERMPFLKAKAFFFFFSHGLLSCIFGDTLGMHRQWKEELWK